MRVRYCRRRSPAAARALSEPSPEELFAPSVYPSVVLRCPRVTAVHRFPSTAWSHLPADTLETPHKDATHGRTRLRTHTLGLIAAPTHVASTYTRRFQAAVRAGVSRVLDGAHADDPPKRPRASRNRRRSPIVHPLRCQKVIYKAAQKIHAPNTPPW